MRCLLLMIYWLACGGVGWAESIAAALTTCPRGSLVAVSLHEIGQANARFTHHAEQQLRLASVTKLFVSAAALHELGPDYHFTTRLYALAALDAAGACPGLLIQGGGSPCLDEHFSNGQPEAIFDAWINALRARGLQRVDGPLLVDHSLFTGPISPPTYPQDHANQQQWYSAPAAAFAWLDNCIEVRVRPGPLGAAALVDLRPASPRIEVINKTRTVGAVKRPRLLVQRAHHSNTITVSGAYATTTAWFPMAIHEQPNLLHADHFRSRLIAAGIPVAATISASGLLQDHPTAVLLHEQRDPLLPALAILNQRSLNVYGEQILRLIGAQRHGSGSISAGNRAVEEVLQRECGLDPATFAIFDGSGLSYDNRASAEATCKLLRTMAEGPHAHAYHASLKTMEVGHPPQTVHCKTGTLAVARCLAGYFDQGPRRFAFAILLNRDRGARGNWSSQAKRAYLRILAAMIDQTT